VVELRIDAPDLDAAIVQVGQIKTMLEEFMALTQGQIDALSAQITTQANQISTAVANIQGDVDDLKSRIPPDVDTSALDSSVAALGDSVAALQALDLENPPTDTPPPTTP
jgi:hypothetical protein